MKQSEYLNRGIVELFATSFKGFMLDEYRENPQKFPFTRALNAFYHLLDSEYNIKFDKKYISEEVAQKIDKEFMLAMSDGFREEE